MGAMNAAADGWAPGAEIVDCSAGAVALLTASAFMAV
jgi:hypothetical protein